MKTPKNSSGITDSWIEYILTLHEQKTHSDAVVTVESFTCDRATKPGESFNAELVKVDVEAKLKTSSDSEETSKNYNLIAKFLSLDPFSREVILKVKYHLREYIMYSQALQELNTFQATHTNDAYPIQTPEYVYGKCTRKDYVLVMQNMKPLGYSPPSKETGLDLTQVKLALEHAARIHAISYSYNQTEQKFLEKFPCFDFNPSVSTLFKPVVFVSLDNTIRFLRSKKEYEDMAHRLEEGRRMLPAKFEAMWDNQSRHKLLCLTHGDFWNNNLLFDQSNQLSIIDWQISQWNSPLMDIHYLLATSTIASIRKDHLNDLLLHYHTTFIKICSALNVSVPDWSYEEFKVEYDRLSLVGFLMGLCLIQGTLSKAGEKINNGSNGHSLVSSCTNKFKSLVAKVVVPLSFKPSMSFIIRFSVKQLLKPIARELISGENKVMNERLLELIHEANEKGLIEIMNL